MGPACPRGADRKAADTAAQRAAPTHSHTHAHSGCTHASRHTCRYSPTRTHACTRTPSCEAVGRAGRGGSTLPSSAQASGPAISGTSGSAGQKGWGRTWGPWLSPSSPTPTQPPVAPAPHRSPLGDIEHALGWGLVEHATIGGPETAQDTEQRALAAAVGARDEQVHALFHL